MSSIIGPIAAYGRKLPDGGFILIGYNAVEPGWWTILKTLDKQLQSLVEYAIQHATVVKEDYRDKECQADAFIRVVQVKEKFGSLRVYIDHHGLGTRVQAMVQGAISMAEALSLRTCKKCGAPGERRNEMTGLQGERRYGKNVVLCETHANTARRLRTPETTA